MSVSMEAVCMAKSWPRKNQSERSDLPCHIIMEYTEPPDSWCLFISWLVAEKSRARSAWRTFDFYYKFNSLTSYKGMIWSTTRYGQLQVLYHSMFHESPVISRYAHEPSSLVSFSKKYKWQVGYSVLLSKHECFTGKYTTRKIHTKPHSGLECRIFYILTCEWKHLRSSSNLRKSSEIFWKCLATLIPPLDQSFWRIFENLRKVVGNLRKIDKIVAISMSIQ